MKANHARSPPWAAKAPCQLSAVAGGIWGGGRMPVGTGVGHAR